MKYNFFLNNERSNELGGGGKKRYGGNNESRERGCEGEPITGGKGGFLVDKGVKGNAPHFPLPTGSYFLLEHQ